MMLTRLANHLEGKNDVAAAATAAAVAAVAPATSVGAASVASVDIQRKTTSPTAKSPGILKKETNVLSEILSFLNDANNP